MASQEIGERYNPDYVVIGEASSLDIKRGQRGRAEVVVETYGRSAHSSNPEKGINAVKQMIKLLSRLGQRYTPPTHPILGSGILELTDIISYPYPGLVWCLTGAGSPWTGGSLWEGPGRCPRGFPGNHRGVENQRSRFQGKGSYRHRGSTMLHRRNHPSLEVCSGWLLDDDHPYVTSALAAPKSRAVAKTFTLFVLHQRKLLRRQSRNTHHRLWCVP